MRNFAIKWISSAKKLTLPESYPQADVNSPVDNRHILIIIFNLTMKTLRKAVNNFGFLPGKTEKNSHVIHSLFA